MDLKQEYVYKNTYKTINKNYAEKAIEKNLSNLKRNLQNTIPIYV